MKKKTGCNCSNEFDAQIAFKRLSEKYNELAEILIDHFSETGTPSRSFRGDSAIELAKDLLRIVGGERVPEGKYKHCCLVGKRNNNGTLEWFCTGVLVNPNTVLTAAHCYDPTYSYIVGLNTINQNHLDSAEIIPVKKALPHPGYQQTRKYNDIAVLVLRQDAQTEWCPMASAEEINQAPLTTLVGFGNDDINSTRGFGIKREVTVNIESIRRRPSDNLDSAEIQYDFESDLEFVAGGKGHDSCNGDSGGPAYIYVNETLKVAGLTSRASAGNRNPCGDGGIYTRIDANIDFINGVMQASK